MLNHTCSDGGGRGCRGNPWGEQAFCGAGDEIKTSSEGRTGVFKGEKTCHFRKRGTSRAKADGLSQLGLFSWACPVV